MASLTNKKLKISKFLNPEGKGVVLGCWLSTVSLRFILGYRHLNENIIS